MRKEHLVGARYLGGTQTEFAVWAPLLPKMELVLVDEKGGEKKRVPMEKNEQGYFKVLEQVGPGALYMYALPQGKLRPDPASRYQPFDVHGPSMVVDSHFPWTDSNWKGLLLSELILYELHVGTFTHQGTFRSVINHLEELKDLGITALELMPVSQFPGKRNWGYDGVYPFAVQTSYGGPDGLKHLVNACHAVGLAVILDVVYNHMGPEGNYLRDFGPYFTSHYKTPWGDALNFDDAYSDGIRNLFIENALSWIRDFHIDGLRLDAVHAIHDRLAVHFLEELNEKVKKEAQILGRNVLLIAENDLNDSRPVTPQESGGFGLDGTWSDDFHHSLHSLLTGETKGYYEDFGEIWHLGKAFEEGVVYTGQYSQHRKRHHGRSFDQVPPERLIVCTQNHDQIGNRMLGERMSTLLSFEQLKLAAGALLLSPFTPLLFMGEEYGEKAPFIYFIDHLDPQLVKAVQEGRKREFQSFQWQGEVPDPKSEAVFQKCQLNHHLKKIGDHKVLYDFYKKLISVHKILRREGLLVRKNIKVDVDYNDKILTACYGQERTACLLVWHYGTFEKTVAVKAKIGNWHKWVDSTDAKWLGQGGLTPTHLESEGELKIHLFAHSFVFLSKMKRDLIGDQG